MCFLCFFFFFQAEDGIRDVAVTGVQTCALPISYGGAAGQNDFGLRLFAIAGRRQRNEKRSGRARGVKTTTGKMWGTDPSRNYPTGVTSFQPRVATVSGLPSLPWEIRHKSVHNPEGGCVSRKSVRLRSEDLIGLGFYKLTCSPFLVFCGDR